MCTNIKDINLGTLPNGVFPKDDGRVYLYKRSNGHLYLYKNYNEEHICCEDGKINKIPIFTDMNFTHYPTENNVFMFIKDNILYYYNKDGVVFKVVTNIIGEINYAGIDELQEPTTTNLIPGVYVLYIADGFQGYNNMNLEIGLISSDGGGTNGDQDYFHRITLPNGDIYFSLITHKEDGTINFAPFKKIDLRNYKVYSAKFSQIETDNVIVQVLENTIGDIIWTRSSAGYYRGQLPNNIDTSKFVCAQNHTKCLSTSYVNYNLIVSLENTNTIRLMTLNESIEAIENEMLYDKFIEIRIYN